MFQITGLLWILATPSWATPANTGPTDPAIQRVHAFIHKLKSIEGDFEQRIEKADSSLFAESSGHFVAARPHRFRWDYKMPFVQVIVSDSQVVWYYEPELKQATRTGAELLKESPAAFLTSGRPLDEAFRSEKIVDPLLNLPAVRLTPLKPEGSFQEIVIILHPSQDELLQLVVMDSLGQRSRFSFHGLRINAPVADKVFSFTPPDGVDILDEPSAPQPALNTPQ